MTEYRFYSFVNFYLSPIQHGIQTGHASVDLMTKYVINHEVKTDTNIVCDWACNWKTYIILNGGNNVALHSILDIAKSSGLPWISFNEDGDSLDGLLTCVGVVVPDTLFKATESFMFSTDNTYISFGTAEIISQDHPWHSLINIIRRSKLV